MHLETIGQWRSTAAVLLLAFCMSLHAEPREESIQEVRKLNEQAAALYEAGQYQKGIPLAQRALAISEQKLGARHTETASSLDMLGQLYRATANFAQAEASYQRALTIRQKTLGPEHPKTADLFNRLALVYFATSAYPKAEALHQQALAIREKVLGPEDPITAGSLSNLASVYYRAGDYAKAEALHQRALLIMEKALGKGHPRTANALSNLASVYYSTGDYAKAKALYQRALPIVEKASGEHPATASLTCNLALTYSVTGAYDRAEPLFERAVALYEKTLGPEHPEIGGCLGNLGVLYAVTGAYAKAEPLHRRVLAIEEKGLGPEHPRTASSLNSLGELYFAMGDYARAAPLHQRALQIYEKVQPEHSSVGDTLRNLATVYSATGAYAKAEPLYQRALGNYEKALGQDHPKMAAALEDLGDLYSATGDYAKAEPLLQRALAAHRKALGPDHPQVAMVLNSLGNLYSATNAHAKAEPLYRQAQNIQARNSERFLLTGSEYRKQAYLQELAKDTYRNVSYSVSAPSPASIALGFTGVLQHKGRVLDEVSGSVARLRQSVAAADRELFEQLADVASQFSTLTYQGLGNLSPAQYRQRLDELRQRQEQLETELAERSAEFRQRVTPVSLTAVSRALPAGAVLVEWFRYQPFDPRAPRPDAQRGAARYAAYVLKARGEPSMVDVGDAQAVEAAVREFLDAVNNPTRKDVKQRARNLSDKIIKPLSASLNGAERVLLSPDGILNLVPMAALLDENDRYLIQRFEITYLTSGRDVLRMADAPRSQSGAIIFADPDYGQANRFASLAPEPRQQTRSADLDRSGIVFRPLANTAREAQTIRKLLKLEDASVRLRLDATESNLKQLHGPRILHVASHGFFLTDQELATQLGPNAELAMRQGENPLVRAGIALAGANTRRSGDNEDGILTALEATQLDLHGTELVVLSACDSGVGQVQNGEGVYGLRRALFIAGAQTQIASLWKVMDGATRTLMEDYYQRLLKGEGRSAALRQAQQKMLAVPQRSHPYYWASFVPIGNWAPLTAEP